MTMAIGTKDLQNGGWTPVAIGDRVEAKT